MTRTEAANSSGALLAGSPIPIPPSLAGRARRSRSSALGGALPVSAGMSFPCMTPSSASSDVSMLGVVRAR